MAHRDDVAVCKQPIFDRRFINGGAVGGLQVCEYRILAVPGNFRVLTRYSCIWQAQVRIIAASDDIGAFLDVVGPR